MQHTQAIQERLLTYDEAADYMRCSKVFIWKQRRDGKLKAVMAGRKVLFQRSAIDDFLKINQPVVA